MAKPKKKDFEKSSGNVFADLNMPFEALLLNIEMLRDITMEFNQAMPNFGNEIIIMVLDQITRHSCIKKAIEDFHNTARKDTK